MANSRFHDLTDIGTLDVSDIIGVDDASDLAGPTKKSTFQKVIDLVKSVVRLNELQTPNTTVNMGGQTIQNVADPVAAQHAATKSYVDANSGGAGGVSNSLAGLALDTPQQWRLPPGRPFLSRGDLAMTADRLAVAPFTAEIPFTISGLACQVAVAPTGSPTVRMAVYEWDDTNHTITGPPLADSGVLTSNNVAEVLSAAITPVDLPAGKYATAYHSPDLLTLSVVRAADGWVESQSDEWRAYAYSYENSSGGILDYTASQPRSGAGKGLRYRLRHRMGRPIGRWRYCSTLHRVGHARVLPRVRIDRPSTHLPRRRGDTVVGRCRLGAVGRHAHFRAPNRVRDHARHDHPH